MTKWLKALEYDPRPQLLGCDDEAVRYFVQRDLLDETVGSVRDLWELPAAHRILRRQSVDGSWPHAGPEKHPAVRYSLIETWRELRFLVEQFGMTRQQPQVARAAEFVFTCQSPEGDLRGFLANQYASYYTGALMALLIQAGYGEDPRIAKGLRWLLSMRQDDGGWTIPLITHKLDRRTQYRLTSEFSEPLQPDRSRPFSHNWTGMVLRAFAVHPAWSGAPEVLAAARLLKSRFFQADAYTSYKDAGYWLRFEHPFWWNNLVAALDSLSRLGLHAEDPDVQRGIRWLQEHQLKNGLWRLDYRRPAARESTSARAHATRLWVSLAICRIFKRLFG